MVVFIDPPVIGQYTGFRCDCVVIGDYRAGVSVRTEVLAWIEAVTGGRGATAHGAVVIAREMCLRGVLDDGDVGRHSVDRRDVRRAMTGQRSVVAKVATGRVRKQPSKGPVSGRFVARASCAPAAEPAARFRAPRRRRECAATSAEDCAECGPCRRTGAAACAIPA